VGKFTDFIVQRNWAISKITDSKPNTWHYWEITATPDLDFLWFPSTVHLWRL